MTALRPPPLDLTRLRDLGHLTGGRRVTARRTGTKLRYALHEAGPAFLAGVVLALLGLPLVWWGAEWAAGVLR